MLLEDLQVVLKVAEFRSITAAATALDMRTATASAAVKRVEAALGSELFIRTTRQLRLSAAGERYLPECEKALLMLDLAKQNIKEEQDTLDGEIRISLSSDLGRNLVTPWLDEFMDANPNVTLRSNISDSNIDFYRDSIDMALRYGSPNDSNMYGFKICDVPRLLCATKEYLEQNGEPKHPDDLVSHNALLYQLHDTLQDSWKFSNGTKEHKVKLKGNRASNDGDLVKRWCVAGQGVTIKSCLDMSSELLSGKVVNVMPEFKPTPTELWLICPSKQSITPGVRQLRDLFRQKASEILTRLSEKGIVGEAI
ncbi:LysR family transcriptional regulator [Vibrio hannami]|uniref:LysR family transcriptional regulator n=1 Tax=Vibrio hannami TaxID=2717094 RepID=UPI00240ED82F|nr:LysR family transcriptional regulator [Vibrio hannami]MDG3086481.1 LysR family transcriptional regulator [Vibrio hannami]